MGFRGLLKRLGDHEKRKEQQDKAGQNVEPPSNTQPPPSSSSVTPRDSVAANRDLWDEAYEGLRVKNPELIQKYEQIIIEHGKEKTNSVEPNLAPPKSHRRESQLRQIVTEIVEGVDLAQWRLKAGNHSIVLREHFEKGVKIILAVKDFLSDASSDPHGAMLWAGVCVFLSLLENPMNQNTAAHDCLESVPFTVRRLRVMERLIRPELSGLPRDTYHEDSVALIRDFEETVVKLYTTILEFQIRLGRQYSERWAVRYGRDIFKADDWADLKNQINLLETKCTDLARDLSLEKIEAGLRSSDATIQTGFEQIQKELEKTAASIERQTLLQSSWRQTDEEREIIQLLRKANPYENQKKRVPKRVSETCKWVFENKKFLDWSTSERVDLLWISAKPGSGKSVVAKTFVDEQLISLTPPYSTICYFFFKDISTYQRSPLSAMAAILHQLFAAFPSLVQYALFPYELNGKELVNLLDTMFDILQDAAADPAVGQIVCVLDALDECDEHERAFLIERINALYRDSKDLGQDQPKLKFFLTSRPYDDIQSQFHQLTKEMPTIHLSGDEEAAEISEEIDHVTRTNVQKLAAEKGFDDDMTEFLLEKLLQVENRTYLWLSLIIDEIRLSHRRGNRREIEKLVSELPQSVIDAYDSILNKSRDKKLARELLHIILAAKVPLSLREMSVATALAGDLSYTSYDDIGLESLDALEVRLRNICGLFVAIDDGYVFLIHQTAKDYLIAKEDSESGDWMHSFEPQDSETLLVRVCVTLLSFECFSSDPLPTEEEPDHSSKSEDDRGDNLSETSNDALELTEKDSEHISNSRGDQDDNRSAASDDGDFDMINGKLESYNDSHPLFEYAAKYWATHCHFCALDFHKEWLPHITSLCNARSTAFKRWFAIFRRVEGGHLPMETTSLNMAVNLKFLNVLQHLLEQGEDPSERDGHGAQPLQRAAQDSFEATRLLVEAGADINAEGWEAPWVDEIDEDGSEREVQKFSGTPLYMAVGGDNVEVVEYLIQNGASVDLPSQGRTPLFLNLMIWNVIDSALEIFQVLIKHGANVNQTIPMGLNNNNGIGWAPIHFAVSENIGIEALEILVNNENTDINAQIIHNTTIDSSEKDDDGGGGGDDDDKSSSSSSDESYAEMRGMTALHLAIKEKRIEAVKLLLQHGADVHIRTEAGVLPLGLALSIVVEEDGDFDDTFKREAVELLEECGAKM